MTRVYARKEMEAVMHPEETIRVVEEGFRAYSRGEVIVPPVGELLFENPRGDCHIKYGYRVGDDTFTIKIGTGFPENIRQGKNPSNGLMLVFGSRTGELEAILHDEGFLTGIRTAAAGAIAAKLLAPSSIDCIGIVGAGTQGRLQLEYLKYVLPIRRALVWSRSKDRARAFRVEGFDVQIANSVQDVAKHCELIVTTTCSSEWLLGTTDIRPGTHITALGADGGGKQELEPELFARAAVRAVDSRKQCAEFGDSSYAVRKGLIGGEDLIELGELLEHKKGGRQTDTEITIADLTGVAIQDIQIAKLALDSLLRAEGNSQAGNCQRSRSH